MSKSKIEWTDYTWNPISGCTKVSQGCKNCYAERFAGRKLKPFDTMVPRLLSAQGPRPREFRDVQFHPESFDRLRKIKEGSRVFVCSISDLFHEAVKDEWIDKIFQEFEKYNEYINWVPGEKNKSLTFQVLTKRPQRAFEYLIKKQPNPLSNVWIGVSVEDQETADERIPILMKIPAVVNFISIEPMLGPIDILESFSIGLDAAVEHFIENGLPKKFRSVNPEWIICGGESGPGARPMASDWVRSIRDVCLKFNYPFFFKQWGEFIPKDQIIDFDKSDLYAKMDFIKQGKKHTGNILDGVVYNQFPQV